MCGADIHYADQLCGSSQSEALWFCFWRAIQSLISATMAAVISALSRNKRIPRELDADAQRTHYFCGFAVMWHRRTTGAAGLPDRAQERSSVSQQTPDEHLH